MIYFKRLLDDREYEISSYVKKYILDHSSYDFELQSILIMQQLFYFTLGTQGVILYITKNDYQRLKTCGPNFGEKQLGQ